MFVFSDIERIIVFTILYICTFNGWFVWHWRVYVNQSASLASPFVHFVRKMIRIPRGISPASGRGAVAGLSCPQKKTLSGMRTDFFNTGLASPPMNSVPAGYFTQIGNKTAAEQRSNCLYATPHGPEPKPVRTSSGRLPVSCFRPPAHISTLWSCILAITWRSNTITCNLLPFWAISAAIL